MQSGRARRTDDGASAVEYGLLVAAVAAILAAIIFATGDSVVSAFAGTCDEAKAQLSSAKNC